MNISNSKTSLPADFVKYLPCKSHKGHVLPSEVYFTPNFQPPHGAWTIHLFVQYEVRAEFSRIYLSTVCVCETLPLSSVVTERKNGKDMCG